MLMPVFAPSILKVLGGPFCTVPLAERVALEEVKPFEILGSTAKLATKTMNTQA